MKHLDLPAEMTTEGPGQRHLCSREQVLAAGIRERSTALVRKFVVLLA